MNSPRVAPVMGIDGLLRNEENQSHPVAVKDLEVKMSPVFIERMTNAFALYEEFLKLLDEPFLQKKLGTLPSNTIGQQLWCVIGARES